MPQTRSRREQLQRRFKLAILAVTSTIVLGLLAGTSHGRYASRWALTRSRWAALRALGRTIDHAEVEAEWRYRRHYDIEQTRKKLQDVYDQYNPKMKGLLDHAGLDTAHALLRWGNFDYASGQARWVAAEIPRGVTVPPSRVLPPSLFLASRPSWWAAAIPWPAIGPDVFGGQDPAGHAHRIPAQVCFDGTPKKADGTLSFSAPRCYGTASGGIGSGSGSGNGNGNGNGNGARQAPDVPSNLKIH